MKVKLLSWTPDAERLVATAMLNCRAGDDIDKIYNDLTPEKIEQLLEKAFQLGHLSVFEHAYFNFSIEGVSRNLTHQLVRHRIASYTQRSQRFTKPEDVVWPDTLRGQPIAWEAYQKGFEYYEALVKAGVPKEDARYVLPSGTTSSVVMSINARSLFNFFELRCCKHAQTEIRDLAEEMLALVKIACPMMFKYAGRTCTAVGKCREGKKKFCA